MQSFPQSIRELSCLPFSDAVNAVALAANTPESIVIPTGARFVIFSGTADFYVKAAASGAVAAVPGDTTDGSACELNPTMRDLKGIGSLSAISASTCVVTAAFYS